VRHSGKALIRTSIVKRKWMRELPIGKFGQWFRARLEESSRSFAGADLRLKLMDGYQLDHGHNFGTILPWHLCLCQSVLLHPPTSNGVILARSVPGFSDWDGLFAPRARRAGLKLNNNTMTFDVLWAQSRMQSTTRSRCRQVLLVLL